MSSLENCIARTQKKLNDRLKYKPLTRKQLFLLSQAQIVEVPDIVVLKKTSNKQHPKKKKLPPIIKNTNTKQYETLEMVLKNCRPLRFLIEEDRKKFKELGVSYVDWKTENVFQKIKTSKINKKCVVCGAPLNKNFGMIDFFSVVSFF